MTIPGSEYNLWLGTGSSDSVLGDLIHDLSRRSSPPTEPFAPHATLLSSSIIGPSASFEEIKATVVRTVASLSVQRIVCKFDKLEAGASFFQCVYVKLQKRESEGLLELHTALRKVFGDAEDPEGDSFFPHMSLVYGDLQTSHKAKIMSELYTSARASRLEDGRDAVLGFKQFETTEVQIVRTVGKSSEWEIVATIPLASSA